jgi:hypothetical protein
MICVPIDHQNQPKYPGCRKYLWRIIQAYKRHRTNGKRIVDQSCDVRAAKKVRAHVQRAASRIAAGVRIGAGRDELVCIALRVLDHVRKIVLGRNEGPQSDELACDYDRCAENLRNRRARGRLRTLERNVPVP